MFKLKLENIIWWPAIIREPVDGGTVIEHECEFEFELLEQDEFDKLAEVGDRILITGLLRNWKSIGDIDGEKLEFNQGNLEALLQIPYFRASVLRSYMQAVSGAAIKN